MAALGAKNHRLDLETSFEHLTNKTYPTPVWWFILQSVDFAQNARFCGHSRISGRESLANESRCGDGSFKISTCVCVCLEMVTEALVNGPAGGNGDTRYPPAQVYYRDFVFPVTILKVETCAPLSRRVRVNRNLFANCCTHG